MKTFDPKNIIVLYIILCSVCLQAQVGIGNTEPKSTLDISASNSSTPLSTDGLLIPRVDAFPLANPSAEQHGMLVYLTTTDGAFVPGFYYWNNSTNTWENIGNAVATSVENKMEDTDTDTKIQVEESADEDIIRFDTNGSERMVILDNGNIGIGTNTVAQNNAGNISLEIAGDVPQIHFDDQTGSQTADFVISNGGEYVNFGNTTAGTTILALGLTTHADNVGIGTTTPMDKLHVVGNIRMVDGNETAGYIMTSNANGTASWSAPEMAILLEDGDSDTQIQVEESADEDIIRFDVAGVEKAQLNSAGNFGFINPGTSPSGSSIWVQSPGNDIGISMYRGNGSGGTSQRWDLKVDNDESFKFRQDNSVDVMTLDDSGFVGIGENNPTTILNVKSTTEDAILKLHADSTIKEARLELVKFGSAVSSSVGYQSGTGSLRIRTDQSDAIVFEPNATESMRIQSNGNVGIAEPNPQEKLHVVGNIRMVDGNETAGYIMTSDANGTANWAAPVTPNSEVLEQGSVAIPNNPSGEASVVISFTNTYTVAPAIQISVESGNFGEFYMANVKFKTPSQFEIHVMRVDTIGSPISDVTVNWMAY